MSSVWSFLTWSLWRRICLWILGSSCSLRPSLPLPFFHLPFLRKDLLRLYLVTGHINNEGGLSTQAHVDAWGAGRRGVTATLWERPDAGSVLIPAVCHVLCSSAHSCSPSQCCVLGHSWGLGTQWPKMYSVTWSAQITWGQQRTRGVCIQMADWRHCACLYLFIFFQLLSHIEKLRTSMIDDLNASNVFYKKRIEELGQRLQEQNELIITQRQQVYLARY